VSASGSLVLHAELANRDAEGAAAAIAEHFQFRLSNASVAEIVRQLMHDGITAAQDDALEWWENIDGATKNVVIGALGPSFDSLLVEDRQPIRWAPDLFSRGDQPGDPATGSIDITGRARCLVHGPHIMVLPGDWLLVLELVFSPEAADYEFAVEVSAGARLAHRLIRPQRGGLWEMRIELTVHEGEEHPVDIRVSSERAAFDGTIRLESATLLPKPMPEPAFGVRLAAAEN
jgi:hypothetical protein